MLQRFPNVFGTNYEANKEQLNKVAVIQSKMVRNKVAGYITKMNGRAAAQEEEAVPQAE